MSAMTRISLLDRLSVRSVPAVLAAVLLWLAASPAAALETAAREAILLDAETGNILMEKDADTPMPPASMSKIMTVYMVFERIAEGRLSLDDELPISEKAWRKGGSKMFIEVGNRIRVEDLLRGVIVQSGNDASIALAEGLAGTEEAFAAAMTETARELGLSNSHFTNATGWPDPEHYTTARDLANLARHLINDFPEHYHYFSETEFTWNGIRQGNRNPLLYRNMGADGLKTGHTEEAGYGLTASAERDGRRLILVVTGLSSAQERADEAARLLEWGFREFDNYALFAPDEAVDEAPVWLGASPSVPAVVPGGLTITLSREARDDMTVTARYDGPVPAPIEAGQRLGTLVVSAPGTEPIERPLVAAQGVERLGVTGRLWAALEYLILGVL